MRSISLKVYQHCVFQYVDATREVFGIWHFFFERSSLPSAIWVWWLIVRTANGWLRSRERNRCEWRQTDVFSEPWGEGYIQHWASYSWYDGLKSHSGALSSWNGTTERNTLIGGRYFLNNWWLLAWLFDRGQIPKDAALSEAMKIQSWSFITAFGTYLQQANSARPPSFCSSVLLGWELSGLLPE